jgi:hypothetical protein
MLLWADQIITATNNMRSSINDQIRSIFGRGAYPEDGDKVICCRNVWDTMDQNFGNSLVNGTIGYLKNSCKSKLIYPKSLKLPDVNTIAADLVTNEGECFSHLQMDEQALKSNQKTLTPQQEFIASKKFGLVPLEFNYGYAITCHRAQGSQWDKVLVVEESFPFSREEHARWLYTAITRAAKKLVLVR